jgi:hypothetical protein
MAVIGAAVLAAGGMVVGSSVEHVAAAPAVSLNQVWSVSFPGETVRESSPEPTSSGIAFGTFSGNVHVLNPADGTEAQGWPAHDAHPINGSPAAIALPGQSSDTLILGTGEAATTIAGACSGGSLWALNAGGGTVWHENLTDPNCSSLPFQSSFTLGTITPGGGVSASIGSLGLLFFSVNAASGAVNPGFPYYANDAQFATPALTVINGAPALIEGIDSFSTNGGAIVALDGSGHVIWKYPTKEVIHSSPAVGVDANGSPYIAVGAGDYYATHGGSPDSDTVFDLDLGGHLRWRQDLGGITLASPAIADVTGSGAPSIVEATDGFGADPNKGALSVLDPVTGNFLPGWKEVPVPGGAVIGGPTTADFGAGYQDILVPTGGGIDVFDGRSAQVVATLDAGLVSFQNSPLVINGPSGFATGVVTVGTQPNGTGVAQYFAVGGAPAASVAPSAGWPMFHHDPQHTGSTTAFAPPAPACTPHAASPPPTGKVVRLAGPDRDATAVAISMASFPSSRSAKAVVLASDANYPDALAGGPLAVAKQGPLLITPPGGVPAAVMAEVQRVVPAGATVYVLGGPTAVGPNADAQLTAAGFHVTRLAGVDRFATAATIAGALGNPTTVFEVTGLAFPDGLAAGPAAAKEGGAILLTNGPQQSAATSSYLAAHPGKAYAIGGPAAAADPHATSIAGADRDATALDVAQEFFTLPVQMAFAVDTAFPDALSGGPWAGAAGPLLLVPPCGTVPSDVLSYVGSVKAAVGAAALFGGTGAVGDDVLSALDGAL